MSQYQAELLEQRKKLDADLRNENSWLALVGLFWLDEGRNTFGASDENDITFPGADLPAQIGAFIVDGDAVTLQVTADTPVDVDGVPAKEALLRPDSSGSPTLLKLGALAFILLQREDGYAIRLWDNASPERESFPGRQWYPVDENYRIEGRYERFSAENIVSFGRRNGSDFEANVEGVIHFNIAGQALSLLARGNPDEGDLFVMFRDATNSAETYGSGRYLSVAAPKDGQIVIDFNRAYNPPCAFTPYATCPLPPAQNHLPVAILAGERK